jgi:hypothetical protein
MLAAVSSFMKTTPTGYPIPKLSTTIKVNNGILNLFVRKVEFSKTTSGNLKKNSSF